MYWFGWVSDDGWAMTDGVEEVMVVGHGGLAMLGGDTDGWTADDGRVITGGRRSTGGVRQVGQSDGQRRALGAGRVDVALCG